MEVGDMSRNRYMMEQIICLPTTQKAPDFVGG